MTFQLNKKLLKRNWFWGFSSVGNCEKINRSQGQHDFKRTKSTWKSYPRSFSTPQIHYFCIVFLLFRHLVQHMASLFLLLDVLFFFLYVLLTCCYLWIIQFSLNYFFIHWTLIPKLLLSTYFVSLYCLYMYHKDLISLLFCYLNHYLCVYV